MFSKDGERETASSTPKCTVVTGKEMPSQGLQFPVLLASMLGLVTGSGQSNKSRSEVCTTSGLRVKYSILSPSFPNPVTIETHSEDDSITRWKETEELPMTMDLLGRPTLDFA